MPTPRTRALPHLLALMLAISLAGCGPATPEESIAAAKEMIARGEYRPAAIELANAAQQAPNLMEARWLLGKVALDLGEGAKAEKELRKALELGQTQQAAQPLLAKAVLMQGELDRVLKETASTPADMAQGNKAAVLGLRGQALVAQGNMDAARLVLEDALRLEPTSLEALIGMTALHGYRREYADARRWVEQALKSHAQAPEAWSALGDLEMAQGQRGKAEEAYSNAIKHRPHASMDMVKRALVRVELNKLKEAEQDIATLRALGLDKHPNVSYAMGRLFFAQKKYRQAAEALEASMAVAPGNLLNDLYLAIAYHHLGQQEKALNLAGRLAGQAPRSRLVKTLLGSIQIAEADFAAANATLKSALERAPNDADILNLLTTSALLSGDAGKALEYASRMAQLDPDSHQAKTQLMTARLLAGESLGAQATGKGAYNTDLLLALDALRNRKLAEVLQRADRMQKQYPDQAGPFNLKAAAYLMAAEWDKAKPELEKALKVQPNEPSATRNLARIEVLRGNPGQAQALLKGYVAAQPGDADAALQLADVEAQLGNSGAIAPLLLQALQRNPGALEVRARLAAEYLRAGRIQDVLTQTKNLTEAQYRAHPVLLEIRGKALILNGELLPARSTFEQWARLVPGSAAAQFYLSDSLARSGDAAGARKALSQSVKLNPRYLPARVGEIKAMVLENKLGAARAALAKLRQDFGEHPEALGLEGWFALGTNDFPRAEKLLAAALAKNPNGELAILLSRAQWGQKKHDAAFQTMDRWLKAHPDDLAMLMQRAGALLSLKRNDQARAVYAQVVKLQPRHVPALNNLAWLSQDKDLALAIRTAREAEAIAPDDPYVKDTLGMLLLRQGDSGSALRLLREASSSAPGDTQIQLHYGQALARQQRTAEARKVLEAIVRQAPASTHAKEAQSLLASLGGR